MGMGEVRLYRFQALAAMPDVPEGKLEDNLRPESPFYLFEHRDGLRSAVAMANGVARHFGFAAKLKGQAKPLAVWFVGAKFGKKGDP